MTCAQQAVSYLESIIRLNNLLLSHTFSCPISVLSTASSFFARGERAEIVIKGCSHRFYKIIWKTLLMEYFLIKAADLNQKLSNSTLCQIILNSFSGGNFELAAFFMCCIKSVIQNSS